MSPALCVGLLCCAAWCCFAPIARGPLEVVETAAFAVGRDETTISDHRSDAFKLPGVTLLQPGREVLAADVAHNGSAPMQAGSPVQGELDLPVGEAPFLLPLRPVLGAADVGAEHFSQHSFLSGCRGLHSSSSLS